MKNVLALLIAGLFLSCGGDDFTANCGTWGEFTECRELNDTELEIYNEVAKCMGINDALPSPTVVIVAGESLNCGDLNTAGCHTRGFVAFPETEGDILGAEMIWRHEFTHEILELTTGGADRKHRSIWFSTDECIGR